MLEIIVATHGDLAKSLVSTAKMFFGDAVNAKALGLYSEDSPDDFEQKIEAAINETDAGKSILILTDLLGGTPFNRSVLLQGKFSDREIAIFTGVNLPMLMTSVNHEMMGTSFEEAVANVTEEASNGVTQHLLSESSTSQSSDDDEDF